MEPAAPTARLGQLWRAPATARLERTSFGLSGGMWTLPVSQRLEVPALDEMRIIVNLSPLSRHAFWSEGLQRRSAASKAGAIRIAPMHETAWAEVTGDAFCFAQIYIPSDAMLAIDRPPLPAGATTAFRDPGFDAGDPLVAELTSTLLAVGSDSGATLYRDHLALALLSHLDRRYGERKWSPPPVGALDPRRLRLALELLHEADETPTLAELGRVLGLSVQHFARSFRKATGVPPHAYLRLLRMERAKRMLEGGSATVTHIALDCGYATPSAFATAFLRTTGMSPTAWRNRRRH